MTERAFLVASSVFVAGIFTTALLLLARALTGGWTWAIVATAAGGAAFLLACGGLAVWAKSNPTAAERFVAAWGRAGAFQSGGWERTESNGRQKP